ncbi:MAG TPA: Fic family protein [Epsilonproteobacteria bacterium]|nr:Fic family protein [Campylobacterota bacterium]
MGDEFDDLEEYEKQELLKKLKVTWTYNSNAIEGNTLTEGDTTFIIENGLTVQGKTLAEHNQVVGHVKALDLIYKLLEKNTITEEDLFLLHKAIQTEHLVDYEKPNGAYKVLPNGRWQKVNGKDKHFYYPHPDFIPYLMSLWFKEFGNIRMPITSKEDAVKIYTDMHISFTGIHPFWDGNGRLARLISNLPLLKSNYLPIIIDNRDKEEYKQLQFNYQQKYVLNAETKNLIHRTLPEYQELLHFFDKQYKHTLNLLHEIKESKKRLDKTIK